MTRLDAVNFISFGITRAPGKSAQRTTHGAGRDNQGRGASPESGTDAVEEPDIFRRETDDRASPVPPSRNLAQTLHHPLWLARERRHEYVTPEHLLLGLANDTDAVTALFGIAATLGGNQAARRPGNTIRKAYLCRSPTTRLCAGSVLPIYQSRSPGYVASQGMTSVGVVEAVSSARNLDDLVRLTAKRSVYSDAQLEGSRATDAKPVKVIHFLLVGHLDPLMTLDELDETGVFTGHPPQSICHLPPERCNPCPFSDGLRIRGVVMVKVVAVFGLSGVGKSWLIARLICSEPIMHVQASQLLREEKAAITGRTVTSEALRTGAVLDNQSLLVRAFSRVRSAATMPIAFDGYCVVDSAAGLVEIPAEVIDALSVSGIVFIQDRLGTIVARRAGDTGRIRPIRSEAEIELHQNQAMATCVKYATRLRVGLHVVQAGDEPAFRTAITSVFDC